MYPRFAYTDNSKELRKAMEEMQIIHGTSTPGKPESNGRAERNIRHILEGSRAVMYHAGVPTKLWTYACRYYCLMSNTTEFEEVGSDGVKYLNTPWFKRHGEHSRGQKIPFGSIRDYRHVPSPQNDSDADKMGPKGQPGIFLGYHLNPGGIWSGDYYVADKECFEDLDFATLRRKSDDKPFSQLLHVHRTSDVDFFAPSDLNNFPLKQAPDDRFRRLGGGSNQHYSHFDDVDGNVLVRSDDRSPALDHEHGRAPDCNHLGPASEADVDDLPEFAVEEAGSSSVRPSDDVRNPSPSDVTAPLRSELDCVIDADDKDFPHDEGPGAKKRVGRESIPPEDRA